MQRAEPKRESQCHASSMPISGTQMVGMVKACFPCHEEAHWLPDSCVVQTCISAWGALVQ